MKLKRTINWIRFSKKHPQHTEIVLYALQNGYVGRGMFMERFPKHGDKKAHIKADYGSEHTLTNAKYWAELSMPPEDCY